MQVEGRWIRDPEHKRRDLKGKGFHRTDKGWSDSRSPHSKGEHSLLRVERMLGRLLPDGDFQSYSQKGIAALRREEGWLTPETREFIESASPEEVTRAASLARRLFRVDAMVRSGSGRPPFPFFVETDGSQHQGDAPGHFAPPPDRPSQIHADRVKDCCARLDHGGVMLRFASTENAGAKTALTIYHAGRYYEELRRRNPRAKPGELRAEVQRFCDAACFHFAGGRGIRQGESPMRDKRMDYRGFIDAALGEAESLLPVDGESRLTPEQDKLIGIWGREKRLLGRLMVTLLGRANDKERAIFAKVKLQEYYEAYRFCDQLAVRLYGTD